MDDSPLTKGERTRHEILAAARRLFLSQGFTATPMRQIAREVGITPAAIYNHYPSKDGLFTALLQSAAPYDELFALFGEIEAGTPEDFVRQVFRAVLAFITDHQDYLQLVLIDAQERDGSAVATLLPEVLPRALVWHERLVSLGAGQQHGEVLRKEVPFLVFVRALVSLLGGFMLTQRIVKEDRVPEFTSIDWPEALANVFLYGVFRTPAGDARGVAGK